MNAFADAIVVARKSGGVVFDVPPVTLSAGYAVAESVRAQLGTPVGWKIGATSLGAQQFLKIQTPIYGRIFAGSLLSSGEVAIVGDRDAEIEPEILFRIGADGSVAAAYLGLEIVRPSHDDAFGQGVGFIVADNAAHVAVIIGPEIPLSALNDPHDIGVVLKHNNFDACAGDASMVLGNPLLALDWLHNVKTVRPGDWIATGAITRACPFGIGDKVVADFAKFGKVSATRIPQKL